MIKYQILNVKKGIRNEKKKLGNKRDEKYKKLKKLKIN